MRLQLNAGGVATLGGIALAAWAFWRYRPIEQLNQIVDSTIAAVENTFDGDGNGQLDFMESILGGQVATKNLTDNEKLWEINQGKDTIQKMFIGSKPFAVPADQVKTMSPLRGVYAAPLPTPLGIITCSGGPFWTTDAGRSNAGKLDSRGEYVIAYNGAAGGRTIKGDPRALYCLDALMKRSRMPRLDHAGILPKDNSNANMSSDYGHKRGHAIDLTNDLQMNKLIEAAKALGMPIAWISKNSAINPLNNRLEWPKFALIGGVKKAMGFSSINHNSHYHVILPRPNRALGYWYKSPFQSGSWSPMTQDGGSGGFIPDANSGPPPINEG